VAAGLLERRYGIPAQDPNAWLEAAAARHTSGDEGRMAQRLLDDFRRAQLGPIALELPPSP
jgi:ribosome biogenesis GTPase A